VRSTKKLRERACVEKTRGLRPKEQRRVEAKLKAWGDVPGQGALFELDLKRH